jgi:hypothetical protein
MSDYPTNPLRDLPPWDPEEQDREVRRIRDRAARRQRRAVANLARQDGEVHRRAGLRVERRGDS